MSWLVCAAALARPASAAACEMVVDPAGRGTHTTIQAAVDDLPNPGPCLVTVKPGTYRETIAISGRNTLATSDTQRIVLVGANAIVQPPDQQAFVVGQSRFMTIQGFTLAGAKASAILIAGDADSNTDITLTGNDIHNNGEAGAGGIWIGPNNVGSWITNNLIRSNGRDGVTVQRSSTNGSTYIVNNTIVANQWNGVTIGRDADVYLVNNLIVGNGLADGTTGGRWGVIREGGPGAGSPERITLMNNLFYRNGASKPAGGGDIGNALQTLDAGDEANITTNGTEGAGVGGCTFVGCTAEPGLASLFVGSGLGPDFSLASSSPAAGRGRPSAIVGGAEWVPVTDVNGNRRGVGGRTDIGYAEGLRSGH